MSSSSEAGGAPKRRRSGRLAAKGGGASSAADSAEQRVPLHDAVAKGGGTSLASEVHGPQHEMHLAIERATTFEDVQKLLDKGHTFCRGDGLNCFVLAVCNRTQDLSKRWDLLMKMLQVDSRGILARDQDCKTLLNYFCNDVDKMKQLIALGANLKNVDSSGKTLIHSVLSSDVFEPLTFVYCYKRHKDISMISVQLCYMLLEHKEVQNQVTTCNFCQELVLQIKEESSLACEVFFNIIKRGLMSVEELTVKLQMHPLFFIIQLISWEEDITLKLLLYIWGEDTDKNENVTAIGADFNIVDNYGKSLVECLFSPDKLDRYDCWKEEPLAVQLWKLLIKQSEIQSQASKEGFIRSLVPFAKRNHSVVRDIFENIFQLGIWSVEKLTSELQMHPLIFLVEFAKGETYDFPKIMKSHPCYLEDKTIIITKKIVDCQHTYPSWQKVKDLLNIPDVLTFDIFGYILFTLKLKGITHYCEDRVLAQCLALLLNHGFVPSNAAGVVHPIHALLYNIFINSRKVINTQKYEGLPYWLEEKYLPNFLQNAIILFKDFPIPHKLVQDPETGTFVLDVHLLLSSIMCPASMIEWRREETPFELMALLQLSPCHPLKHFATFFNYSSCYFPKNRQSEFLETFCKLLRLTLEASGRHKFQGVDQPTMECISTFCKSVRIQRFQNYKDYKEISLHRNATVMAEIELSSLQWLSILQIRKTLFLSRSSTTLTLPSLIRGLVAEGRLPKGLEADVLVYKPNKYINL